MSDLKRVLGLGSLTFYGIGLILGAGIYSILGPAAGLAGPGLWLSFALASLAAVLTGLSYAELAAMHPEAGAEYVYLRRAWPRRRWLARTIGILLVWTGAATAATVALAFGGYAQLFLDAPAWIVAALLVLAAALLNLVGVRESSWANVAFTLIEAAGLVALIVVGWRDPEFGEALFATPGWGVLAGAGLIFFAFLGFEDIANLAEETKHPERNVPRAILLAVGVSTVIYVLVALAAVALLDVGRLAQSGSPLAEAMRAGAPSLAGALGGVALFATANTALVAITAASRMLLGLARGGDAPSLLARTLARRKTPALAIAVVAAFALALVPLGGVGLVGSVASLLALVAFASVNLALIRLRWREPDVERPFRVPIAIGRLPLLPCFGATLALLLATLFEPLAYAVGGAVVLLALLTDRFAPRGKHDDRYSRPRKRRVYPEGPG